MSWTRDEKLEQEARRIFEESLKEAIEGASRNGLLEKDFSPPSGTVGMIIRNAAGNARGSRGQSRKRNAMGVLWMRLERCARWVCSQKWSGIGNRRHRCGLRFGMDASPRMARIGRRRFGIDMDRAETAPRGGGGTGRVGFGAGFVASGAVVEIFHAGIACNWPRWGAGRSGARNCRFLKRLRTHSPCLISKFGNMGICCCPSTIAAWSGCCGWRPKRRRISGGGSAGSLSAQRAAVLFRCSPSATMISRKLKNS